MTVTVPRYTARAAALGALLAVASTAAAQHTRRSSSPPLLLPPPPSSSDLLRSPSSTGVSPNQLGRDLNAASRRVSADGIDSEIQRRDHLMEGDRQRTERNASGATVPLQGQRLRNDYEQRSQDYERWRAEQLRRKQALEQPQPAPATQVPPALQKPLDPAPEPSELLRKQGVKSPPDRRATSDER